MEIGFAILQGLGLIVLTIVPFRKRLFRDIGTLTARGKVIVWFGLSLSVLSSIALTGVAAGAQRALMDQTKEVLRLERMIFTMLAQSVLDRPRNVSEMPPPPPIGELEIRSPQNGTTVKYQDLVSGAVSEASARVWVIVHPIGTGAYWVQPPVSVNSGGRWETLAYFGRAEMDVGVRFEIMAVGNPDPDLREAQTLGDWPSAQMRSNVVSVIRGL